MSALPAYPDLMLQVAPLLGFIQAAPTVEELPAIARVAPSRSTSTAAPLPTSKQALLGVSSTSSGTPRAKMPVRGLNVRALPR